METPDFGQLRQTYSQYSNEELLRLATECESLTAPALEALRLVIEERGLEWQNRASEPSQPAPESTVKTKAKMFRWLWPVISNDQEAKNAAKGGACGAAIVAVVTCILSLIAIATGQSIAGTDGYGLASATLFAIIAWRIFRYSLPWAVFGLLVYTLGVFQTFHDGRKSNLSLTLIIALSLIASVRGTAFLNRTRNKNGVRRFGLETVPVAIIFFAVIAAIAYRNERNVPSTQGISERKRQTESGNAKAELNLCMAYAEGQGVPQDYARAVEWCRKAAEQGNVLAEFMLGVDYENGVGVPKDSVRAVAWWLKAAEQGDADAEFYLGMAYHNGQGVPRDYAQAYFWFDLAAAGKLDSAKAKIAAESRNDAASHLSPTDLSRIQERAWKWCQDHPAKTVR